MKKDSSPTIQGFKVRAVRVPMTEPHRTASGVNTESPLVLTDILTDTGINGHSIVFTYTPAALNLYFKNILTVCSITQCNPLLKICCNKYLFRAAFNRCKSFIHFPIA